MHPSICCGVLHPEPKASLGSCLALDAMIRRIEEFIKQLVGTSCSSHASKGDKTVLQRDQLRGAGTWVVADKYEEPVYVLLFHDGITQSIR